MMSKFASLVGWVVVTGCVFTVGASVVQGAAGVSRAASSREKVANAKHTLHLQPLSAKHKKAVEHGGRHGSTAEGSHVLGGRVVNPDGLAAAGVLVEVDRQTDRTDAQGHFKLDKLSEGRRSMHFIGQRHAVKAGQVDIQQDVEVLAPVTVKPTDPCRPSFDGPIGGDALAWLVSSIVEPPVGWTIGPFSVGCRWITSHCPVP